MNSNVIIKHHIDAVITCDLEKVIDPYGGMEFVVHSFDILSRVIWNS